MKKILFGTLVALALLFANQANATVSLLPGASWCPTTPQWIYPASNQVLIYTTVGYVHDTIGQCQILTIGISNYGVPNLDTYGLIGPDYIKSLQQGANVQGSYYPSINYASGVASRDYGWQTYSTYLAFGWYPASMVFHKHL